MHIFPLSRKTCLLIIYILFHIAQYIIDRSAEPLQQPLR